MFNAITGTSFFLFPVLQVLQNLQIQGAQIGIHSENTTAISVPSKNRSHEKIPRSVSIDQLLCYWLEKTQKF